MLLLVLFYGILGYKRKDYINEVLRLDFLKKNFYSFMLNGDN